MENYVVMNTLKKYDCANGCRRGENCIIKLFMDKQRECPCLLCLIKGVCINPCEDRKEIFKSCLDDKDYLSTMKIYV